jgi:hypothetical protein
MASGLLGVGGAVIMVPLLASVLKLGQHRAQGTSLAVTIFTALAALVGYAGGGHVDLAMAALLVVGSVGGAPAGARAAQRLPAATLRRAFGVLVLLVGLRLFFTHLPEGGWLPSRGLAGSAALLALGFAVGFLSGFFGVGGGVVLVPALILLAGVPQHLAQGVSLLFIVPTAISGTLVHARLGNVEKSAVLPLALSASVAAFLAAHLAAALPGEMLRLGFGVLLLTVGARLVLQPARA